MPVGEAFRLPSTKIIWVSSFVGAVCLALFSLTQKAQRKKLGKKEMPFPWGSAPHTRRSFLKKAPPKTERALRAAVTKTERALRAALSTPAKKISHFPKLVRFVRFWWFMVRVSRGDRLLFGRRRFYGKEEKGSERGGYGGASRHHSCPSGRSSGGA